MDSKLLSQPEVRQLLKEADEMVALLAELQPEAPEAGNLRLVLDGIFADLGRAVYDAMPELSADEPSEDLDEIDELDEIEELDEIDEESDNERTDIMSLSEINDRMEELRIEKMLDERKKAAALRDEIIDDDATIQVVHSEESYGRVAPKRGGKDRR